MQVFIPLVMQPRQYVLNISIVSSKLFSFLENFSPWPDISQPSITAWKDAEKFLHLLYMYQNIIFWRDKNISQGQTNTQNMQQHKSQRLTIRHLKEREVEIIQMKAAQWHRPTVAVGVGSCRLFVHNWQNIISSQLIQIHTDSRPRRGPDAALGPKPLRRTMPCCRRHDRNSNIDLLMTLYSTLISDINNVLMSVHTHDCRSNE